MVEFIRSLRILCRALIAGLLMFTALSLIMKSNHFISNSFDDPAVIYTGIIAGIVSIIIGFVLFNKARKQSFSLTEEEQKQDQYRRAIISIYAYFEFGGLFNAILFMLGGNYMNLVMAGISLLLMIMQIPTEDKFNQFGQ